MFSHITRSSILLSANNFRTSIYNISTGGFGSAGTKFDEDRFLNYKSQAPVVAAAKNVIGVLPILYKPRAPDYESSQCLLEPSRPFKSSWPWAPNTTEELGSLTHTRKSAGANMNVKSDRGGYQCSEYIHTIYIY